MLCFHRPRLTTTQSRSTTQIFWWPTNKSR